MWRVILADDEQYVRVGLKTLIPWAELECDVVGEAENGRALLELVRTLKAEIVVLDIRMPGMNGLDAATVLRQEHPEIVLIFLTGYADFHYARAAVDVGAAAYIVKTEALEELPDAIRKAGKMLARSRARIEPTMVALLRALCDGTFELRCHDEALLGAYRSLREGFPACRLLVVWLEGVVDGQDMENLCLLFTTSFQRFSPLLFPMEAGRVCVLFRGADLPPGDVARECEALLPVAVGFCGVRPALALSGVFHAPENMREAYMQAYSLLSRRLLDGETRVLCAEASDRAEACAQEAETVSLEPMFERDKPDENAAWLDGFIRSLRHMDLIAARRECLYVLEDLSRVCYRYDKALSPPDGENFHDTVLTSQTLAGLRAALERAMAETSALIRRENKKIHALIRATDDFIAQRACERISLADIANAVHANPSHLSRFYKEKTGENLFEAVNRLRVERAKVLLDTTDMRAYEVAEAVGFTDNSNFSKFFKKHTGQSPREWARRKEGSAK